jgi:hypothetical protein
MNEDLRKWFREKWVRMDTKGNIKGDCAREEGEGKPKCLPLAKARAMDKKDRATSAQRKRREDPVADRSGKGGKPINVTTEEVSTSQLIKASHSKRGAPGTLKAKIEGPLTLSKVRALKNKPNATTLDKKQANFYINMQSEHYLHEASKPTNPELWSRAKALARSKFDVYPSAYANGWAAKWYKSKGGGWKSMNEQDKLHTKLLGEAKATYCGRCGTTHVPPSKGGTCPALKEANDHHKFPEYMQKILKKIEQSPEEKAMRAKKAAEARANAKPIAPQKAEPYKPLGGRDEKSGRSYSEAIEHGVAEAATPVAVRMQRALDKIKAERERSERRGKELMDQIRQKQQEQKPMKEQKTLNDILEELGAKLHPNALHVKPVKVDGQTKYQVHAVGKNLSSGIQKGEHLSDSELDDAHEMGAKVKHVKESIQEKITLVHGTAPAGNSNKPTTTSGVTSGTVYTGHPGHPASSSPVKKPNRGNYQFKPTSSGPKLSAQSALDRVRAGIKKTNEENGSLVEESHLSMAKNAKTEEEFHSHMLEHHMQMMHAHKALDDSYASEHHADKAKQHADKLSKLGNSVTFNEEVQIHELKAATVAKYQDKAFDKYMGGDDKRAKGLDRANKKQVGALGHVATTNEASWFGNNVKKNKSSSESITPGHEGLQKRGERTKGEGTEESVDHKARFAALIQAHSIREDEQKSALASIKKNIEGRFVSTDKDTDVIKDMDVDDIRKASAVSRTKHHRQTLKTFRTYKEDLDEAISSRQALSKAADFEYKAANTDNVSQEQTLKGKAKALRRAARVAQEVAGTVDMNISTTKS